MMMVPEQDDLNAQLMRKQKEVAMAPKIRVADLSISERDEYISMMAEVDRLNKLVQAVELDRTLLVARETMFYGKIRKQYKISTVESIVIDVKDNAILKTVMEQQ